MGDLRVRVQPRSRRSEIAGERAEAPGRVTVLRGAGARDKVIRVEGIDTKTLNRRLGSKA
jgi:uncharacterized protein YggU (UPF0235/DUF167 family)